MQVWPHLLIRDLSSSEKNGHSSLTSLHIVRRNSKALFRNSATECNTFLIVII